MRWGNRVLGYAVTLVTDDMLHFHSIEPAVTQMGPACRLDGYSPTALSLDKEILECRHIGWIHREA